MKLETLKLHLNSDDLHLFFPLFQKGVTVPAIVGCTLKSLLVDQFAIPVDYVTDRITTIFLDNRPVDDLDRTIIQEGSRVTLSAAMPGLVGATMRRGGFYAALRQGISYAADSEKTSDTSGTVRLKLFNLLLAELAPTVLARGLILERDEFNELLRNLPPQTKHSQQDTGMILLTATF
ncbi:MAG: hypothetical protein PHF56_09105 [Desulfuromonadaceae bacterium]|nr:hypothetical protein [Desulfuromonadaceae bacterium]